MNNVQTNAADAAKNLTDQTVSRLEALTDGCCTVSFKQSGPCGEVTLKSANLMVDGQEVESKLAKGTTYPWFPSAPLKFKNTLARRADRLLDEYGVNMDGKGTRLVPISRLDDLLGKLNGIKENYYAEVEDLDRKFDRILDDFCTENPVDEPIIRRHAMDAASFKGRFIFKVNPPLAFRPLNDSDVNEVVKDTTETLFSEVARDALKLYEGSFVGKDRISQKPLNRIRLMLDKLVSLSFLDNAIANVVDTIEAVLDKLPKAGFIEGTPFENLARWVAVMGNEGLLKAHANGEQTFTLKTDADLRSAVEEASETPGTISLFGDIEEGEPAQEDAIDDVGFGGW